VKDTRRRLVHLVAAVAFVLVGILIFLAFKSGKPQIEKAKQTIQLPAVKTIEVETGSRTVVITSEGTVRASQEISLVPEVAGKVFYVSPSLASGGRFGKGETLLRIDPLDYRLALTLAEAKVRDAESRLQLTQEEAQVAQEEWRMFPADGSESSDSPPPLVAKEPQLAAAKAGLEAARADLEKARLNLDRTEVKAPFDGRVTQENVDVGQYVAPGQALASLYSTQTAEIALPLEVDDLFWFHVPGFTPGDNPRSPATVRATVAGRDLSWQGEVVRSDGRLDERTRMINVVVAVDEPYAKKPPLIVGLFVTVEIQGSTLPDSAVIPRSALRRDDVVWVVDDEDQLVFREVDVARPQGDEVLVKAGLRQGDRIVVSPLKAATDGMSVKIMKTERGDGS
jgi:RND family efflux transporter MFP subunit